MPTGGGKISVLSNPRVVAAAGRIDRRRFALIR